MGNGGSFRAAEALWLDSVSSTNDYLKDLVRTRPELSSGFVVAAREQTRGRGRRGKTWQSLKSGDLTFSFLWRGAGAALPAGTLPMACALAVSDYLLDLAPAAMVRCKWPNDVLVDDAKICGILTEGSASGDGTLSLVIGIGLNVPLVSERDALAGGRATSSVEAVTGLRPEPENLLPDVLRRIEKRVGAWQAGGFTAIRHVVRERLWGVGTRVAATTPAGKTMGIIRGLGDNGELLLEGNSGMISVSSVTALDYDV